MKIIYQDKDLLVIDKPPRVSMEELENELPENGLPRKGIIHRLDKDTSGVLLVAKNEKSLIFFQTQFKNRDIQKTYIALVYRKMEQESGSIKTLIARQGIKQKAYLLQGPENKKTGPRQAETQWKVIKRYKDYTLVEAMPKTGRKHQIRVHFAHIGHPIAGDKLYSFKNQASPADLTRQFLHAKSIKARMPQGEIKKFVSNSPKELNNILCRLK